MPIIDRGVTARGIRGRYEAVDVANDVNRGGRGVGRTGLELFENTVHNHDVLAIANTKSNGLTDPNFFAAKEYSIVETLAGGDCIVAYCFDKGEAFINRFGGKYAAVYFGISQTICAA